MYIKITLELTTVRTAIVKAWLLREVQERTAFHQGCDAMELLWIIKNQGPESFFKKRNLKQNSATFQLSPHLFLFQPIPIYSNMDSRAQDLSK